MQSLQRNLGNGGGRLSGLQWDSVTRSCLS